MDEAALADNAVDTTAAFANLSLTSTPSDDIPAVDTCLAHLKLLHAIHSMKEDVGYTDGLFGLWDSRAEREAPTLDTKSMPGLNDTQLTNEDMTKLALSKLREKRWALYVARAVDRYRDWWKTMPESHYLTQAERANLEAPVDKMPERQRVNEISGDFILPPLGAYSLCDRNCKPG